MSFSAARSAAETKSPRPLCVIGNALGVARLRSSERPAARAALSMASSGVTRRSIGKLANVVPGYRNPDAHAGAKRLQAGIVQDVRLQRGAPDLERVANDRTQN